MRRLSAICSVLLLVASAALWAGCGEGEAESGARVTVYVAAPICQEAQQELARKGSEAGDLKVHAVCLPPVERKHRADLAAAGGNARRATEDSSAVAYLEAPGAAAKFSRSIVESAEIAWLETSSGSTAMARVIEALSKSGSASPRDKVHESLFNG